jgi:HAD superfamily hydrolase (TIGR01549 family)
MDGTVTEPMLDFPKIKEEMGIGQTPILEALAVMDVQARAAAEMVLHCHEEEAAENSVLSAGCRELLVWLGQRGILAGLVTRNSSRSVATVLKRHRLAFDAMVTREHGSFKPSPEPLYAACEQLKIAATDVWMVGDGQYDVEAGLAAGMKTVWLSRGREKPFVALPWKTVADLVELFELLKTAGRGE